MKFDIIVGNPPYHRPDGGYARSAVPLYHHFVRLAKALHPRYITMIIPSRWFAAGDLPGFRQEMLHDSRIRKIVDYENSKDVFPDVVVVGGVCYFLWDRDYSGPCEIASTIWGEWSVSVRQLDEFGTLVRDGRAAQIVRKVLAKNEPSMATQVLPRNPFGIRTNITPPSTGDILLRWRGGWGLYARKDVKWRADLIDKWKTIVPALASNTQKTPKRTPERILSVIEVIPPESVCTETYLVIGAFDSREQAENRAAYAKTRFFRFLLSQRVFAVNTSRDTYAFIPALSPDIHWTDEMLCERYGLTADEVDLIFRRIAPMD